MPLCAWLLSTAIVPVPLQFGDTMAQVEGLGGPPTVAASKSSQSGNAEQSVEPPPVLLLELLALTLALAPLLLLLDPPALLEVSLPPVPEVVVEVEVELLPPEPELVEVAPSPEHAARTEHARARGAARQSADRRSGLLKLRIRQDYVESVGW